MAYNATYKELCARIKAIRIIKGMTLAEVEVLSKGKYKIMTLGSWERGDRKLTLEKFLELCNFYGVSAVWLLETDLFTRHATKDLTK